MRRRQSIPAPTATVALLLALLASVIAVPLSTAAAQERGNVSIIKDNESPSNAEIAVRVSEATSLASATRVVISRDDNFADALASGLMQRSSPLLLVPPSGPLPARVIGEIQRIGAAEAVILGGTSAVQPQIESELVAAGLTVQRRFGGSRIETAIDIAGKEAPGATTAILARAFPADPANPTQAFADALGAGALSAQNQWPILLSTTDTLSPATRDYLTGSDITTVKLVGGTAALSAQVQDELRSMDISTERLAGETRGGTALEIAKDEGANSAADISHVILVDGTGADAWAGGFASAGRAALLDAPILLADGVRLLPETTAFLTPGASFAGTTDELTVTCVVHPLACTQGRKALGLPDVPVLTLDPPRGVRVDPGQTITATLSPASDASGVEVLFDGGCVGDPQLVTTDGQGLVSLPLAPELPTPRCQMNITYEGRGGEGFTRASVSYDTEGPGSRTADQAFVASNVLVYGDIVPDQPVIVNDTVTCTPPGGSPATVQGSAMAAQNQQPGSPGLDIVNLSSDPLITSPQAACTVSIVAPPQAQQIVWGLYVATDGGLQTPLLLGQGTSATFDLADVARSTGVDTRDVVVNWVMRVADPLPSAPQPPPPGQPGVLNNPDGLPVVCDGQAIPAGLQIVEVGATCTSSVSSRDFNILLIQPDRVNVSAQNVTFQSLADTRVTTIRAQLLFTEIVPGQDGSACGSAVPISLGRATAGSLDQPEQSRFHSFSGTAGQSVRIRLDDAYGSGELDPVVSLYGPDGQLLADNDDGDEGVNSRLDATLPSTGTYCVEAAGYETSFGDYLLAVDPAPDFTDFQTLDEFAPTYGYTATLQAGTQFTVEMRRAVGFEDTDPVLEVYDPAGNLIASDDDGGGRPNARIELTVPATGDYQVIAGVYAGHYGSYTLEASFPGSTFADLALDDSAFASGYMAVTSLG